MNTAVLEDVLVKAQPELQLFVVETKNNFMSTFGTWVQEQHTDRLEEIFTQAGKARLRALIAKLSGNSDALADAQETYDASIASLETLGLGIEITGKIAAHVFLQNAMHGVLSAVATVLGIAVHASLAVALPGVGSVLGGIAGTATEKFLDMVFGV